MSGGREGVIYLGDICLGGSLLEPSVSNVKYCENSVQLMIYER